jgi:hypothetical protein
MYPATSEKTTLTQNVSIDGLVSGSSSIASPMTNHTMTKIIMLCSTMIAPLSKLQQLLQ